jgi:hypothetical protein
MLRGYGSSHAREAGTAEAAPEPVVVRPGAAAREKARE